MMRSIAKIWIQWCYDQNGEEGAVSPLPNLLRKWIDRDESLQRYERSLLQMHSRLTVASKMPIPLQPVLLESDSERTVDFAMEKQSPYFFANTSRRSTSHRTLVFASSLGLIALLSWVAIRSVSTGNKQPTLAAGKSAIVKEEETRVLLASTMDATQQIANRLAAKSMSLHSQVGDIEYLQISHTKESAKRGLRFVTQTIPTAAARVLSGSSQ